MFVIINVFRKGKTQEGEDSDDEEWKSGASESEGEEEDDDEEDVRKYLESTDPMVRRNYWLKRETAETKKKRERKIRVANPTANTRFEEDEEVVPKPKRPAYTLDELDKKIVEIVERRAGRKVSKEKKVAVEDDLEALQEFFDKVKGDEIKRVEVNKSIFLDVMMIDLVDPYAN